MKIMQEVLSDIKNQFEVNNNGFGEPQAWVDIEGDRSIEITHEKDLLPKDEEFYSLRLHCSEEEFQDDDFHSTIGIIETYCTGTISDEQLADRIDCLTKISLIC